MNKVIEGQLKESEKRIEIVAQKNPELAEEATNFNQLLLTNKFNGIFNVKDEVYRLSVGISQSSLKHAEKSLYNYYYKTYLSESSQTLAMKEGSFFHKALFEKDDLNKKFVSDESIIAYAREIKPDSKNIRATSPYKERVAYYKEKGLEVIKQDTFDSLKILFDYINRDEMLCNILKNGHAEKAVYSVDKKTGAIKKCKPDFISRAESGIYCLDLKTCQSVEDSAIERYIQNYGCHIQGSYYDDIITEALNVSIEASLLLMLEKELPFELKVKFMDEPTKDVGRKFYKKNLEKVANAYKNDSFTRNPITIEATGLPHWALNNELVDFN